MCIVHRAPCIVLDHTIPEQLQLSQLLHQILPSEMLEKEKQEAVES